MSEVSALHAFGVERFLAEYWQRKPALIRQALPRFESPVDADDLAALALEDSVESRLVVEDPSTGSLGLRCGPFTEAELSGLPEHGWTLLVQAVDHWIEPIADLKARFGFLPAWRIDDVMVSFAPRGGGVGPHFDFYDVFLLQGKGRRRWRLGQNCDASTPVRDDTPLSILTQFDTREDWVLEPGDMLYLPPGVAHWGIALDDCITLSIGFRAPAHSEFIAALAERAMDRIPAHRRYTDPLPVGFASTTSIDAAVIDRLQEMVAVVATDRALLADCFAALVTEPKYPREEVGEEPFDCNELLTCLAQGATLQREPDARFACVEIDGQVALYANGECIGCQELLAQLLCGNDELEPSKLAALLGNDEASAMLCRMFQMGALILESEDQ